MRTLLLTLAFTAVAAVGHAQPEVNSENRGGFELSLGFNGALGFHENLGTKNVNTDSERYNEIICGSMVDGFGVSLNARTYICKNAQAGLGLDYYRGCNTLTNENISGSGGSSISFRDYTQYQRVSLNPHVRLESNRDNNISYYSQVGVVVPLIRNYNTTSEQTSSVGTETLRGIARDKFNLGICYGGGVQFNTERYSISAGLVGTQLVGKRSHFEYTSLINHQGEEEIGNQDIYFREVEYVMQLNDMSNNFQFNSNANIDLPRNELYQKRSNHNLGVSLDFIYRF